MAEGWSQSREVSALASMEANSCAFAQTVPFLMCHGLPPGPRLRKRDNHDHTDSHRAGARPFSPTIKACGMVWCVSPAVAHPQETSPVLLKLLGSRRCLTHAHWLGAEQQNPHRLCPKVCAPLSGPEDTKPRCSLSTAPSSISQP